MWRDDLTPLSETIPTAEAAEECDLLLRAAMDELVRRGQSEALFVLQATQELRGLYVRAMRWHLSGRSGANPLTPEDVQLLQDRGQGISFDAGAPLPPYLTETYRSFSLWYWRLLHGDAPAGPDMPLS